jgi:hypothetical protein
VNPATLADRPALDRPEAPQGLAAALAELGEDEAAARLLRALLQAG